MQLNTCQNWYVFIKENVDGINICKGAAIIFHLVRPEFIVEYLSEDSRDSFKCIPQACFTGTSHWEDCPLCQWRQQNIISYPLFASADTGIFPHAASQYDAWPKAKRGIAMLSVDKFLYPQKQTRCNKFIPCWNDACHILKCFCSFKIQAILFIWPQSWYEQSVTWSHHTSKESGWWSWSPLWHYQRRSFIFISHTDDVKHEIRINTSWLFANQKQESARSMG